MKENLPKVRWIYENDQEFFCFEFLKQLIDDSNKVDLIRSPSINEITKFNDKRDEAVSRLRELAQLRDEGVLTQEEYDEKAEKYKKLI